MNEMIAYESLQGPIEGLSPSSHMNRKRTYRGFLLLATSKAKAVRGCRVFNDHNSLVLVTLI